jgi:hypothetical protein
MPRAQKKSDRDNGEDDAGFVERVEHLNESAHQLIDEARTTFEDLGEAVDLRGRCAGIPTE